MNSKPNLYVFSISHFCEKARWALDYVGIEYQLRYLAPGSNIKLAKQLGALRTTLPILESKVRSRSNVVQGSGLIFEWAEANKAELSPSLNPTLDQPTEVDLSKLEKRLDDVLGFHIRRYYYSEALVDYPEIVKPLFVNKLEGKDRWKTDLFWFRIRSKMIEMMDLGPTQGLESREVLEKELDLLDKLLVNEQPYLIGSGFSYLDITAASLLAPLIKPEEHPEYEDLLWPPRIAADCGTWQNRPCLQWARSMYKKHR